MIYDVVIVGGGFAGVYAAQALPEGVSVALVSSENFMVFQPMLPEVVNSSISPRHVVNSLRHLCPRAEVFRGEVTDLNTSTREVTVSPGEFSTPHTIGYRQLVICPGSVVDTSRVPGMAEHALNLRNVGDAMNLRVRILQRFEEARFHNRKDLLSFAIIGGGFSGVETAAAVLDIVLELERTLGVEGAEVHLISSSKTLLHELSPELGEYTRQQLEKKGMKIHSGRVKSVTSTRILLQDGSEVAAATTVSTIGNAPHPLVLKLIAEGHPGEKGRLITDHYLRVDQELGIWAAGDAAAVPLTDGSYAPPTAQFACRQGTLIGKNITATLLGGAMKEFTFKCLGELAIIGHREAVAEVMGHKFSGFFAWWLWRTIYLLKLPGLERKLRVMLDWTLDLFFPRDITLFTPRYTKGLTDMHLEAGDVLFRPGEPAFSFYMVKKGRIVLEDENGIVKEVLPGEHFGERAILQEGRWFFQAKAAEPTELVALPATVLRQVTSVSHSFAALLHESSRKYRTRQELLMMKEDSGKTASDIMSAPITGLQSSDTLDAALDQMAKHHSLPVFNGEVCVGLLHQDELYYAMLENPQQTVGDLRMHSLPSVAATATVPEIIAAFARTGSRKALVMKDNAAAGIITVRDLLPRPELENGRGATVATAPKSKRSTSTKRTKAKV